MKKVDMPMAQEKRDRAKRTLGDRNSGLIRFAATQLAAAGWLAMTLPSTAVTVPSSYQNQFRVCAGRLLRVNISASAAATACSGSLNPRILSSCVVDINRRTSIAAEEALETCRQVRRPNELASCVVGISRNSQEQAGTAVLDYCRRSLLPVRFAECVVGLRREIDAAPAQAMETCISASDQLPPRDFAPNFVPQNGTPPIQPATTPAVPRDLTPLVPSTTAPSGSGNQTQPNQSTPAPTAPANPGGQ